MMINSQRERDLDKAIDNCGIPLNKITNTESCVQDVMRRIGASESEHEFVKSRIALRVRTAAVLARADSLIDNAEKTLDQFEKEDKEWERKGEDLGFSWQ